MKRCSACGNSCRIGTMVHTSDGKGGVKRMRVCPKCASRSVLILMGTIEGTRCNCGKPATSCVSCARAREKRDLKTIIAAAVKKIGGVAKAYELTGEGDPEVDAQCAGLWQAVEILEAGDF